MAAVYTSRLYGGAAIQERGVVTVPAGERWIVRDLAVASPQVARVAIYIAGIGYIAVVATVAVSDSFYAHWTGRQAVYAGETLEVLTNTGGTYVLITGYQFSDP